MATRALMQNVKIDAVNNGGISPPDHLRSITLLPPAPANGSNFATNAMWSTRAIV